MTEQPVLARVKALPPLPIVAQRLLTLIQQDDSSANDITQVLSSDQALTGKILKLANSSFYGMSGKVGAVSRAVVILGFSAVRNMALGLGMAQVVRQGASVESLADFWRHALCVGAACRTVAREGSLPDPEEAFIAGLLHDLGRLILDMVEPGHVARLPAGPPDRLLQAEIDLVGVSHTRAGQLVARHWNLPERLSNVLRFHHHPSQWRHDDSRLLACVMVGDLLASVLWYSREEPADPPDPVELANHLGISLSRTEDLLTKTCEEVSATKVFLEIAGVESAAIEPDFAPDPDQPTGAAVYLGSDPERAGWIHAQLDRLGWQSLAMKAFLADASARADLAIIDPRAVKPGHVDKLLRFLAPRDTRVALAAPDADLEERLPGVAVLPPVLAGPALVAAIGMK